ncbi:MAG: flagellar hook assembly protein FlgD [Spirochaetales bacterium]|nr:flagellar hook assembly protein FlgD [Spirochaetales bacterium]
MFETNNVSNQMNSAQKALLDQSVNMFNKTLNDGTVKSNELGKDDFLKILITQMQNQDPTKPMEDKEFIAQMAQFSSLEQMTNMNEAFKSLAGQLNSSSAMNFLGKTVQYAEGENSLTGVVEAVTGGDYPQLLVNGRYFDMNDVLQISNTIEGKE